MGQQQLLLIILGVIIVGIAVGVGISQFSAASSQSNKDGVTSALINLGANAYQYKIRPTTLGGGSNSYSGFIAPSKMTIDQNGTYLVLGSPSAAQIQLQGTSLMNSAWKATCSVDSTGRTSFVYTGW